jgi:hypothetical protein
MLAALHERGTLEQEYARLFDAVLTEDDPERREQLVVELDKVVGARLAQEQEHREEVRAHHRPIVEA